MKRFNIIWHDSMGERVTLKTFDTKEAASAWVLAHPLLFAHVEEVILSERSYMGHSFMVRNFVCPNGMVQS